MNSLQRLVHVATVTSCWLFAFGQFSSEIGTVSDPSLLNGVWKGQRYSAAYIAWRNSSQAHDAGCVVDDLERILLDADDNVDLDDNGVLVFDASLVIDYPRLSTKFQVPVVSQEPNGDFILGTIDPLFSGYNATNFEVRGGEVLISVPPNPDNCVTWQLQRDAATNQTVLVQTELMRVDVRISGELTFYSTTCPTSEDPEPNGCIIVTGGSYNNSGEIVLGGGPSPDPGPDPNQDYEGTEGFIVILPVSFEVTPPPVTQLPITEPPITQPPATQLPVTQPPVTEPPITQLPGTQPSVAEPPITQPPLTEPPGTQPPGTQPPITQPPGTDFPGTEPPGTQPPGTQPPGTDFPGTDFPGTEPPGTQPPGTDFPGTEPPVTQPPFTEPFATDPPEAREAPANPLLEILTPAPTGGAFPSETSPPPSNYTAIRSMRRLNGLSDSTEASDPAKPQPRFGFPSDAPNEEVISPVGHQEELGRKTHDNGTSLEAGGELDGGNREAVSHRNNATDRRKLKDDSHADPVDPPLVTDFDNGLPSLGLGVEPEGAQNAVPHRDDAADRRRLDDALDAGLAEPQLNFDFQNGLPESAEKIIADRRRLDDALDAGLAEPQLNFDFPNGLPESAEKIIADSVALQANQAVTDQVLATVLKSESEFDDGLSNTEDNFSDDVDKVLKDLVPTDFPDDDADPIAYSVVTAVVTVYICEEGPCLDIAI